MEAEEWHIPLSQSEKTLKECLSSMEPIALEQSDIPLIIKLIENPKYDIGLFAGYVDLFSHDTIHILVGRGLMLKDEAFVIGYTMGSSKKMRRWRRNLFYFCAKYFYPEGYNFTEEERFVFYSGVMAGSRCASDLSKVQFKLCEVSPPVKVESASMLFCIRSILSSVVSSSFISNSPL